MENGKLLGVRRYKTKVLAPFQPNQIIILNAQTIQQQLLQAYFTVQFIHSLPTHSFRPINYTMQTFTTFLAALAAGTAFAAPTSYQNQGVDHLVKVRMIDRSGSSETY
jgi:hypothetical protein